MVVGMPQKFNFFWLFIIVILFSVPCSVFGAAYEASTLHNSVSRSESVQKLFYERMDLVKDNKWNFDFFGNINWVPGFKIYSANRETGERQSVDMRLIRTYGSLTYMHPFGSSENGKKSSDIMAGLTMTGYHYGLTRKTQINRGDAGTDSVTDYKYTQFFDDIFAASFIWEPYIFVQSGLLINNQVEPNDDGTMDYFNSSGMKKKWFAGINLFGVFDTRFSIKKETLETLEFSVNINSLAGFFIDKINPLIPGTEIGFKKIAFFNDELYESVWVNSIKTGNQSKDKADLYIFSVSLKENYKNMLFADLNLDFELVSEDLIEKRNLQKIEPDPVRKFSFSLGYDHFHNSADMSLLSSIGYSRFWDAGLAVHSENESHAAHGFFYNLKWSNEYFNTGIKASYNSAEELEKLIETVDKFALEWEISVSLDFYSDKKNPKTDIQTQNKNREI